MWMWIRTVTATVTVTVTVTLTVLSLRICGLSGHLARLTHLLGLCALTFHARMHPCLHTVTVTVTVRNESRTDLRPRLWCHPSRDSL
jgi:hypothetical protein